MEDLERMLDIAKDNFRQLGGELSEDRRRLQEKKECERFVIINLPISDDWVQESNHFHCATYH